MIIEEEIEELDFELGMLKDQEKDIDTYNQICALIAKCQNLITELKKESKQSSRLRADYVCNCKAQVVTIKNKAQKLLWETQLIDSSIFAF